MNTTKNTPSAELYDQNKETYDTWFSGLIDFIKVEHLLLQTGTASKPQKELYNNMILGDSLSVYTNIRQQISTPFIKEIIFDYIEELRKSNQLPNKLAFALSDSKLLVWSEINDNDESTENALLLTEAKINGKYQKAGFYINSTIIEKSDNLPIPPHYQIVKE